MRTAGLLTVAAALALLGTATGRVPAVRADAYGGVGAPVARGAGFFQLAQRAGRWELLDPDGRPFWMRAVYGVDAIDGGATASAALRQRFHGSLMAFTANANQRLRRWGFNALGGYASSYALPLPTYARPQGNPVPLPFVRELNIACYAVFDSGGFAPGAVKTLLAGGVDPAVYHGWMGLVPDVFDPNFATDARGRAADLATPENQTEFTALTHTGGDPQPSLLNASWLLATIPDDTDCLYGFGPGPAQPGAGDRIAPHIGWIVAVTRPEQSDNAEVGLTRGVRRSVHYADAKVYSKAAWADFLAQRYHTIAALNAAWGSGYTTFGSDGGWPNGRGLLDESGRHAWIGDDYERLSTAAPAARQDMDAFLALYADRYFATVTGAIRAATPHQLIFSSALDTWGGLTRPQILAAAGRYCDAVQVDFNTDQPATLAATYRIAQKPLFVWMGIRADDDSAVQGRGAGGTQAQRAATYAADVRWLLQFKTGGVAPIIGFSWWEYMDKVGERANWGLVTPGDNAYDGREDTPEFGEQASYGDFLDAVTATNHSIDALLSRQP